MLPSLPFSALTALTALAALAPNGVLAQNPPLILPFPGLDSHFRLIENNVPFSLDCDVGGTLPAPNITWVRDDEEIDDAADKDLEIVGSALHFRRPNAARHAGRYHCRAANELGTAKSAVVHLSGQPAPKHAEHEIAPVFTTSPTPAFYPIGTSAVFTCAATGSPEPDIIWTKNGVELTAFRNQEKLSFEAITLEDIATYACNASNSVGYVYKMVYLSILTQKPFFSEILINRSVSIGQEVFLRCSAKGYPKPVISWSHQGKKIDIKGNFGQADRGDLIIKKVLADSAGVYQCTATNSQGSTSTSGELEVVSTTTIKTGPGDLVARVRGEARMRCEVLWDPSFPLTILWKKNNVDIDLEREERFSMEEDNTLVIRDLKFDDFARPPTKDAGSLVILLICFVFEMCPCH